MKKIYKVNNIFSEAFLGGGRSFRLTERRSGSRISPMNHRLWTVIGPMLFVAFGLFGVNVEAWGYWSANYYCSADAYVKPTNTGYVWVTVNGTSFNGAFSQGDHDSSNHNAKINGGSLTNWSAPNTYGITAQFFAKATNGDYVFKGWYNNANGTGSPVSTSTTSNCSYSTTINATKSSPGPNLTLYAIYAKYKTTTTTTTIDFGDVAYKSAAQNKTFTIDCHNVGTWSNPSGLSGVFGASLSGNSNDNTQQTCTVTVTLDPKTAGKYNQTLTVSTSRGGSIQVTVKANVTATPSYTWNTDVWNANGTMKRDVHVGETLTNVVTTPSSGTKTYTIENWKPTGSNNTGATKPTFTDNTLYCTQAGTLTLRIAQEAETNGFNAGGSTINIEIKKRPNTLSCSWGSWSKNVNVDSQTGVTFSSNNTEKSINIQQTSGNTAGNVIATYSAGTNKITSIYNLGTATWTLSQAEDYKYVAASETLTVNVVKGSTTCNFYTNSNEHELGDDWVAYEWTDYYATEVSFQAAKNMATAIGDLNVYIKLNTGAWQKYKSIGVGELDGAVGSYDYGSKYFTYSLASNVRGIKFENAGSYRRAVKNLSLKRHSFMTLSTHAITMPTNTLGGNHTTAKFTIDYSTCADQIKVVSNHPHITVSPASFASNGEGSREITVTYACKDPESIEGYITVYTPYENDTIHVYATTEKKSQAIEWSELFAGEPVSLPQTFTSNDAASATSKLPIKYNSGDPEIIAIAGDSLSFTIVGTGTTTLTATQAGNDEWKSVSDSKTINASNKKIQRIVWNQQFTRSLSVGNEIPLTARVYVMNVAEGTETESPARTEEIVYTCPDANDVIEILNGTNIHVLGYGNTTITASVAGNEEYEAAASVTLPVRVREIQTGECDMPLVFEQASEIEFFQSNLNEIIGSPIAIDHANGIPDKLSFDVRGAAWKLGIEYYKGSIQVQQSTDGKLNWSGALATVSPAKNSTASSGEVQLDPNVTHIRFVRPSGGQGYHYVGNIQITRLPYITTEETTINLGNVSVGENREFTIPVSYANVKGNMNVTRLYDDNGLTVESAIEADCGDMASYNLQASVLPQSVGPWTNTVTVQDPLSGMFANIVINATIQKGSQTITWNPTLDILTTETPTLNAVASSGLTVSYTVTSGNNTVARIEGGQVVILQPGQFTITASQGGNVNYNAAESVAKTFTVTAETLTLIGELTSSDITYGQSLLSSTLTGASAEDSKGNAVEGTFSWKTATTAPNAGNAQEFAVVFTPSTNAAWYSTLETTTAVNVAKANATLSWTSAPTPLAHNASATYTATSASDGDITYSIISGDSYARIDANTGALTIDVPGNTITIQASQAEGTNHNVPTPITVDVVINAAPVNEFTNAAGDGDWQNPANWTSVPTGSEPNVIVSGALEIDENVTVGNLTIENTGSIAVITGGTLTVKGTSEDRSEYGDVHVLNDGAIHLGSSADLQVRDFTLDAKLGDADNAAASGQVDSVSNLHVNRDAYFKMSFDVTGQITYGWYDFVVPFEVDALNGVFAENGTPIIYGTDYIIMSHSEEMRARNQKAWNTFTGTLEPGRIYTITFEETKIWNTFLFKKKAGSELANSGTYTSDYSSAIGEAQDRGWNGFGNGTLQHRELTDLSGISKVQMYNHTWNRYDVIDDADWKTKALAVGTAFSIQVGSVQPVVLVEADAEKPLRAPRMDARMVDEFCLTLTVESADRYADRLWVSASEEATGEYVIGRDLLKMGTPTSAKVAQMWTFNNGLNLCDIEMPLVGNNASTPLNLYAPQAGTYEIAVEKSPEDATLYLTQNGDIVWNLSMSPYTIDLTKGTTSGYGLRIVADRQTTTDVENSEIENQSVRKVLIDDKIYIVTPEGKMYDIVGKSVKY